MQKELVGGRHDVVSRLKRNAILRELEGRQLLFVEAIGNFGALIMLMALGSISVKARPEQVWVKMSRGTSASP